MSNSWQEFGLCYNIDGRYLNMFFDEFEQDPEIRPHVISFCNACPVRDMCEEYGKATKSDGVWGGKYLVRGKESEPKSVYKTNAGRMEKDKETV